MLKRSFLPPVDQGVPPGAIDFHCHLDRAWTYLNDYWLHAQLSTDVIPLRSLAAKQNMVGDLHRGPAYQPDELKVRMDSVIQEKYDAGERALWAVIDTAPDDVGTLAIDTALTLRGKWLRKGFDLRVGAYPIFGFKTPNSDRERIIREVAPRVQFACGLPERDERKGHTVTFERHIRTLLEIGCEHRIPVHIHLDQTNTPWERGTERLIEARKFCDAPVVDGETGPTVWAVHVISPSCYNQDRFRRLVDGLLEYNIGVVVCPVAGCSMRQLDAYNTPTHNCIARVLDLINAGISVRLGTDNIGDAFVPTWKATIDRETLVLSNLLRFYDFAIYRKLLLAQELTDVDRDNIRQFLEIHRQANSAAIADHPWG